MEKTVKKGERGKEGKGREEEMLNMREKESQRIGMFLQARRAGRKRENRTCGRCVAGCRRLPYCPGLAN